MKPLTSPLVEAARRQSLRGLSIVELMIGVAIGLAVVAGGAKMLADGLIGNRRTLVEARISQDLRAATDIIARDLRRAGYWGGSLDGVTAAPQLSSYRSIVSNASSVAFNYAQDPGNNNALENNEYFGFQRAVDNNGTGFIQMKMGRDAGNNDNWQPLTDPRSVNVTNFEVAAGAEEISLGSICRVMGTSPCCSPHPSNPGLCKQEYVEQLPGSSPTPANGIAAPAGTVVSPSCPQLIVRSYRIRIVGTGLAANDQISREITETVRVRNDEVTQVACP